MQYCVVKAQKRYFSRLKFCLCFTLFPTFYKFLSYNAVVCIYPCFPGLTFKSICIISLPSLWLLSPVIIVETKISKQGSFYITLRQKAFEKFCLLEEVAGHQYFFPFPQGFFENLFFFRVNKT